MNAEQVKELTQMKQAILLSSISSPEEREVLDKFYEISWDIIINYHKFLDRSKYKKNAVCTMSEKKLLNPDAIIKMIPKIEDKKCDESHAVRELASSIFNHTLIKTYLFFEKKKIENSTKQEGNKINQNGNENL